MAKEEEESSRSKPGNDAIEGDDVDGEEQPEGSPEKLLEEQREK